MADDWKARPVSGEIMTAAPAETAAVRVEAAKLDVVDAEFETLAGPTMRAEAWPTRARVPDVPTVQGLDMLRRTVAVSRPGTSRRGGAFFWSAGLVLVAAAFWLSGGHALVLRPAAPETPAGQAKLRFRDVDSRLGRAGDRIMLFVDGEAVNEGDALVPLPPIHIKIAAADGHVTRYNLGTADRSIAPGGRFSFSSRLEAPRSGVKSVSVSFRENGNAGGTGQEY